MTVSIVSAYAADETTSTPWEITVARGDVLVVAVAAQHTYQPGIPSGFDGVVYAGSRPSAVYWKSYSTATTESLSSWFTGAPAGPRLRALGLVLRGVDSVSSTGWQETEPSISGQTLLFSQRHSVAGAPDGSWGAAYQAGEASSESSWSVVYGDLVSEAPVVEAGSEAAAWCAVSVVPATVSRYPTVKYAAARVMPSGASSLSALFDVTCPGVIAHRGGSQNWSEHSLTAYTHSVYHGAPALEISCHRTSDGVWFACHDVTLSRVDPSAPATDVREMTWDEVSQYTTFGEPIMRLDEFVEAYGDSHFIVADPKNSALYWQEMVEYLDPARTILKFSGDATWLASQWKAAGWFTWGYFYESSMSAEWAQAAAPVWDSLGMEIGAGDAAWEWIRSFGKPLIGHVAFSEDQYLSALDRGVSAVMVADVMGALPLPAAPQDGKDGKDGRCPVFNPGERYFSPVTYFWPDYYNGDSSQWREALKWGGKTGYVILNKSSGQWAAYDQDFDTQGRLAVAAGAKCVLFYVKTQWGAAGDSSWEPSIADHDVYTPEYIMGQVANIQEQYADLIAAAPAWGVFLDEFINGWGAQEERAAWYASLLEPLRDQVGPEAHLVGNCGTNMAPVVLDFIDRGWINCYCSFEKSYAEYVSPDGDSPIHTDLMRRYPAECFWHIVHDVPEAGFDDLIRVAQSYPVGHYYFTEQSISDNPYAAAPASWLTDPTASVLYGPNSFASRLTALEASPVPVPSYPLFVYRTPLTSLAGGKGTSAQAVLVSAESPASSAVMVPLSVVCAFSEDPAPTSASVVTTVLEASYDSVKVYCNNGWSGERVAYVTVVCTTAEALGL